MNGTMQFTASAHTVHRPEDGPDEIPSQWDEEEALEAWVSSLPPQPYAWQQWPAAGDAEWERGPWPQLDLPSASHAYTVRHEVRTDGRSAWAVPVRHGEFRTPDRARRSLLRLASTGEALARFELCRVILGHCAVLSAADLARVRAASDEAALALYAGFVAEAASRERAACRAAGLPSPVVPVITPHGVRHETRSTVLEVLDGRTLSLERYRPFDLAGSSRDLALAVLAGYAFDWRSPDSTRPGLPGELSDRAARTLGGLSDQSEHSVRYLPQFGAQAMVASCAPDAGEWKSEAAWLAKDRESEDGEEA